MWWRTTCNFIAALVPAVASAAEECGVWKAWLLSVTTDWCRRCVVEWTALETGGFLPVLDRELRHFYCRCSAQPSVTFAYSLTNRFSQARCWRHSQHTNALFCLRSFACIFHTSNFSIAWRLNLIVLPSAVDTLIFNIPVRAHYR